MICYFDFTANKTEKTVYITREFDAPLLPVWDAFTKKELLDQQVAPAPWIAKTKYMNFEVGGKRLQFRLRRITMIGNIKAVRNA